MGSLHLRAKLEQMGASDAQLNSKIYGMVEQAIMDEEVSLSETVQEQLRKMQDEIIEARNGAKLVMNAVKVAGCEIDAYREKIDLADKAVSEHVITDKSIIDGILTYRKTLEATLDVFGKEAMSEEVIKAAISAGSYGMWRSIMGPKNQDSKQSAKRKSGKGYDVVDIY